MRAKLASALSLASDAAEQSERVAAQKRKVEEAETVLKRKAKLRKKVEEEERRAADRLARDEAESARAEAMLDDIRGDHAYRTEVKSGYFFNIKSHGLVFHLLLICASYLSSLTVVMPRIMMVLMSREVKVGFVILSVTFLYFYCHVCSTP